ncbi:glycosyltransferase family 2 protein [Niabella aquatica]
MPFISICIPAYQRPQYLKRLLDSIRMQSFKDFEVIITDDSPDDSVYQLFHEYSDIPSLYYHKNPRPLGTPANWNAAIALAKGQWIKLMHDDDWFANETSLQQFADCAKNNDGAFIFSAFINVYEDGRKEKPFFPEKFRIRKAKKEPAILLAKNFIGAPSTTMHKNDKRYEYDTELKWLVDIDMYRRRMETDKLVYISQPLVNLYMSNSQVTSYTKNIAQIEIPEHFHYLNKMGIHKLNNILVYDYNWRFIRNFSITDIEDLRKFGYSGPVHPVLTAIITAQAKIYRKLLRNGVSSKLLMALHFIKNKKLIK